MTKTKTLIASIYVVKEIAAAEGANPLHIVEGLDDLLGQAERLDEPELLDSSELLDKATVAAELELGTLAHEPVQMIHRVKTEIRRLRNVRVEREVA